MGSGHWDSKLYSSASAMRASSGIKDFAYSHDTLAGSRNEWKAHKDLNPKKIKDSVNHVRESRDSDEHPESRAIAVLFDVTGSMRYVPQEFQKNLNKLMSLVMLKGKIEHPQILVGAIGDATCDRVPLQISQFESNNLVDEHLRKLVLEGGGGGHITESYELALYAMAHLTSIDCLEKRGKKGYLFLSGDETPYPAAKRKELDEVLGIKVQADVPLDEVFEDVKKKYEVFFIIPATTQHADDPYVRETWAKYLGQRVLRLEDPGAICELIAATVASEEGVEVADIVEGLKQNGSSKKAVKTVKAVLAATK